MSYLYLRLQEERAAEEGAEEDEEDILETPAQPKQKSIEELERELNEAIESEDYERASQIRDEIKKRK